MSAGVPQVQKIGDAFDRCRFALQGPNRRLRAQGRLEHVVPGARVVERIAVHSFCEAVYAECAKLSFNFHGQFQL